MRLFLRAICAIPFGNKMWSSMASSVMRLLLSSSVCMFAGRLANSASAPVSPIELLSRNKLARLAGSLPDSQTAPRSPMRLFLRASCVIPFGNRVCSSTASSAMRLLLSSTTLMFAGRLANSALAPASPMRLFMRLRFVRSCGSCMDSCMVPRVMRLPLSSIACKCAGRLAKSASAPASPTTLPSNHNLLRPCGRCLASQAAPRSPILLPVRLSSSRPVGNWVPSCMASSAMEFPSR
mmetsp:Transcript_40145/g.111584  ORF Transcript_40145/g.111584 Transcript_40145/m.111584 type:complete len:237 (-) Transcript_40145:374-1084(-)